MIRPNLKMSLNQCKCALQRTCRKALKYASTRKQRGKSGNTRMSKALAQPRSYGCGYSNTSDKTSNATPHKHNKKYTSPAHHSHACFKADHHAPTRRNT